MSDGNGSATFDKGWVEPVPGWCKTPHKLFTYPGLNTAEKWLLVWLWSHEASFLRSMTTNRIVSVFGRSARSIWLGSLEREGFLVRTRPNRRKPAVFVLTPKWGEMLGPHEWPSDDTQESPGSSEQKIGSLESPGSSEQKIGSLSYRKSIHSVTKNRFTQLQKTGSLLEEDREEEKEEENTYASEVSEHSDTLPDSSSSSPKGKEMCVPPNLKSEKNSKSKVARETREQREERFEKFWKSYPRKIGKPAALKAWESLLKADPSQIDEIRAGAKYWFPIYSERPPEFVPHASTWLNGRRYLERDDVGPDGATATQRRSPDGWLEVLKTYNGVTEWILTTLLYDDVQL